MQMDRCSLTLILRLAILLPLLLPHPLLLSAPQPTAQTKAATSALVEVESVEASTMVE
jgi:hypothetical protein